MRSKLLIAAAAAACALAVPVVAAATPAPRSHPAFTDQAGDAAGNGLLHANVPAADILSTDVVADATTISFVIRVAGAHKLLAAADRFSLNIGTTAGSLVSLAGDNSSQANLVVAYGGLDEAAVVVSGTTTVDSATHTITARYPLADLNAAEASIGGGVFSAETVVSGAYSRSFLGDDQRIVDQSLGFDNSFTLGG